MVTECVDFARKAIACHRTILAKASLKAPFSASGLLIAPETATVDHVAPIIGEAKFEKCFQQRNPHTLFDPTAKAHIDRVPFAMALMHIRQGQPTR